MECIFGMQVDCGLEFEPLGMYGGLECLQFALFLAPPDS